MTGLSVHPESTLIDRVLLALAEGPKSPMDLCSGVLGLAGAPRTVAERITVALLGADPRLFQQSDGRWAMVPEAQGSPLLDECAFAVVDVETTGMRAADDDRITEVAVVIFQGARREIVLESLVNPGRRIPPVVAGITGITDAMVQDAPPFAEVADQLLSVLAGRVFVAHNARFDWGFLAAELQRARGVVLDGPRLCTVRLARRLVRDVRRCGLDSLSQHFGLENDARHRAAGDALVTAQLLGRLLPLAREEGARTLQDILAIQTRPRPAMRRPRLASPSAPSLDAAREAPA